MNLEVLEVLITYVTNSRKAEVMLHIGAGQRSNYQIILELYRYDISCNNLKGKKNLKWIWRYQRYYSPTLHIGGRLG